MKESRGQPIEPIVPVVNTQSKNKSPNERNLNKGQEYEEENDTNLKAAIEASLREAERGKTYMWKRTTNLPRKFDGKFSVPSFEFSPEDEDAIYLFAAMVEKMKT